MQITSEQFDRTCLGCKYPLSQLDPATRACPECGRRFDPADPWSMRTGHVLSDRLRLKMNEERLRKWLGPAPWVLTAMRVAVGIALASNLVFAGGISASWVVLCVLTLLISCIYYIRAAIRRSFVKSGVLPATVLTADRITLNKSRRLFAIAALLLFFRIPFYTIFLISLPWLSASGHNEYTIRPYFAERPRLTMIGLFPIVEVRVNYQGASYDTGLGIMHYTEMDDGKRSWRFNHGLDPLHDLPW